MIVSFAPTSTPKKNSNSHISTIMSAESYGNDRRRKSQPTDIPPNMIATIVSINSNSGCAIQPVRYI